MSRQIKFRAWNKKKGIMNYDNEDGTEDYWDGIYTSEIGMVNSLLNIPDKDEQYSISTFRNKYEVMQYTGLKDKNGTEVYEGDVVKGTAIQIEGGFDYFGVVEFITQNTAYGLQVTEPMRNGVAGGWSIEQLRTRISLDHITGEVIGNIWEDGDLIDSE